MVHGARVKILYGNPAARSALKQRVDRLRNTTILQRTKIAGKVALLGTEGLVGGLAASALHPSVMFYALAKIVPNLNLASYKDVKAALEKAPWTAPEHNPAVDNMIPESKGEYHARHLREINKAINILSKSLHKEIPKELMEEYLSLLDPHKRKTVMNANLTEMAMSVYLWARIVGMVNVLSREVGPLSHILDGVTGLGLFIGEFLIRGGCTLGFQESGVKFLQKNGNYFKSTREDKMRVSGFDPADKRGIRLLADHRAYTIVSAGYIYQETDCFMRYLWGFFLTERKDRALYMNCNSEMGGKKGQDRVRDFMQNRDEVLSFSENLRNISKAARDSFRGAAGFNAAAEAVSLKDVMEKIKDEYKKKADEYYTSADKNEGNEVQGGGGALDRTLADDFRAHVEKWDEKIAGVDEELAAGALTRDRVEEYYKYLINKFSVDIVINLRGWERHVESLELYDYALNIVKSKIGGTVLNAALDEKNAQAILDEIISTLADANDKNANELYDLVLKIVQGKVGAATLQAALNQVNSPTIVDAIFSALVKAKICKETDKNVKEMLEKFVPDAVMKGLSGEKFLWAGFLDIVFQAEKGKLEKFVMKAVMKGLSGEEFLRMGLLDLVSQVPYEGGEKAGGQNYLFRKFGGTYVVVRNELGTRIQFTKEQWRNGAADIVLNRKVKSGALQLFRGTIARLPGGADAPLTKNAVDDVINAFVVESQAQGKKIDREKLRIFERIARSCIKENENISTFLKEMAIVAVYDGEIVWEVLKRPDFVDSFDKDYVRKSINIHTLEYEDILRDDVPVYEMLGREGRINITMLQNQQNYSFTLPMEYTAQAAANDQVLWYGALVFLIQNMNLALGDSLKKKGMTVSKFIDKCSDILLGGRASAANRQTVSNNIYAEMGISVNGQTGARINDRPLTEEEGKEVLARMRNNAEWLMISAGLLPGREAHNSSGFNCGTSRVEHLKEMIAYDEPYILTRDGKVMAQVNVKFNPETGKMDMCDIVPRCSKSPGPAGIAAKSAENKDVRSGYVLKENERDAEIQRLAGQFPQSQGYTIESRIKEKDYYRGMKTFNTTFVAGPIPFTHRRPKIEYEYLIVRDSRGRIVKDIFWYSPETKIEDGEVVSVKMDSLAKCGRVEIDYLYDNNFRDGKVHKDKVIRDYAVGDREYVETRLKYGRTIRDIVMVENPEELELIKKNYSSIAEVSCSPDPIWTRVVNGKRMEFYKLTLQVPEIESRRIQNKTGGYVERLQNPHCIVYDKAITEDMGTTYQQEKPGFEMVVVPTDVGRGLGPEHWTGLAKQHYRWTDGIRVFLHNLPFYKEHPTLFLAKGWQKLQAFMWYMHGLTDKVLNIIPSIYWAGTVLVPGSVIPLVPEGWYPVWFASFLFFSIKSYVRNQSMLDQVSTTRWNIAKAIWRKETLVKVTFPAYNDGALSSFEDKAKDFNITEYGDRQIMPFDYLDENKITRRICFGTALTGTAFIIHQIAMGQAPDVLDSLSSIGSTVLTVASFAVHCFSRRPWLRALTGLTSIAGAGAMFLTGLHDPIFSKYFGWAMATFFPALNYVMYKSGLKTHYAWRTAFADYVKAMAFMSGGKNVTVEPDSKPEEGRVTISFEGRKRAVKSALKGFAKVATAKDTAGRIVRHPSGKTVYEVKIKRGMYDPGMPEKRVAVNGSFWNAHDLKYYHEIFGLVGSATSRNPEKMARNIAELQKAPAFRQDLLGNLKKNMAKKKIGKLNKFTRFLDRNIKKLSKTVSKGNIRKEKELIALATLVHQKKAHLDSAVISMNALTGIVTGLENNLPDLNWGQVRGFSANRNQAFRQELIRTLKDAFRKCSPAEAGKLMAAASNKNMQNIVDIFAEVVREEAKKTAVSVIQKLSGVRMAADNNTVTSGEAVEIKSNLNVLKGDSISNDPLTISLYDIVDPMNHGNKGGSKDKVLAMDGMTIANMTHSQLEINVAATFQRKALEGALSSLSAADELSVLEKIGASNMPLADEVSRSLYGVDLQTLKSIVTGTAATAANIASIFATQGLNNGQIKRMAEKILKPDKTKSAVEMAAQMNPNFRFRI